jgi:hypothetical protein
MELTKQDGVFIVGEVVGSGQVTYGPGHETKAGQPVPGFYKLVLSGEPWDREITFNKINREEGGDTMMYRQVFVDQDPALLLGRKVLVRVSVGSVKGSTFVNYTGHKFEFLSDIAAAVAEAV